MNEPRGSESQDTEFEALLSYLRQQRGYDFSGYKRPSLMRRVSKRMQMIELTRFRDYLDYLEVHPEEFEQLFNTVLINVTSFFRDPPAWEFLVQHAVPKIVASKRADEPIRVWCAGCASGEEAYSVAIVFAEALGLDAACERVKVYATDIDEEALNVARLATYSAKDMQTVDAGLREKYFESQDGRFVFRADLRRAVIFGRHDLLQDAPISRLDLLLCRNTLMYFNAEAQGRILARFHFALRDGNDGENSIGGILFLGRAEMLLTHGNLFTPLDVKCRIFAKVPQVELRNRQLPMANQDHTSEKGTVPGPDQNLLRELALEESPTPRLIVDTNGFVVHANQKARLLLNIGSKDVGRPFKDLEISYRPVELRSLVQQAYAERRVVTQARVERRIPNGEVQYLDVAVAPLNDKANNAVGVGISFLDMTRYYTLQQELQHSKEEIQTANEELQSSNEELETTNEELQSTNEELETMNEELQSTNEELQTVNLELRERTDELNRSNSFLESVFASLRSGAVVVDADLNVEVWNDRAADLWGLRADEVHGKSLLNLDIGLPISQLRDAIRSCIAGSSQLEESVLEATTRRGRKIRCRVTVRPLTGRGVGKGAIVLMDETES